MALYESTIKSLPRLGKGKVRDIYAVGNDKMLIVTSDRLSAFDVVLNDPIPDKGRVLNEMANFWFSKLGHVVPNQLTGIDPDRLAEEKRRGMTIDLGFAHMTLPSGREIGIVDVRTSSDLPSTLMLKRPSCGLRFSAMSRPHMSFRRVTSA